MADFGLTFVRLRNWRHTNCLRERSTRMYDVAVDGRFIGLLSTDAAQSPDVNHLDVLFNWSAELARRVPVR